MSSSTFTYIISGARQRAVRRDWGKSRQSVGGDLNASKVWRSVIYDIVCSTVEESSQGTQLDFTQYPHARYNSLGYDFIACKAFSPLLQGKGSTHVELRVCRSRQDMIWKIVVKCGLGVDGYVER